MNEEFSNESPKKDLGFILSLAALLLFTMMGIGIDYDEYLQQNDLSIPAFYFILIFLIDLLMIVGLILRMCARVRERACRASSDGPAVPVRRRARRTVPRRRRP